MRRNRRGCRNRFDSGEDINPMNYISNLADVMLVLAVGIMLALVLHYNIQLETESENKEEEVVEFTQEDLTSEDVMPDSVQKTGNVYYDPASGKYYIIND